MRTLRSALKLAAAVAAFASAFAHAGGPLSICAGAGVKYNPPTVVLNYDGGGTLGTRTKAQADAIVTSSVALWTNVGTANITLSRGPDLPVDVTTANVNTYAAFPASYSDGLNPVIYDSDGSIIDMVLGVGAKSSVLGFAGSVNFTAPTCRYAEGRAVINGFISVSDTTMSVVLAHEIGHLIGMDHTQLDNTQGLASANYPLMYPIAFRNVVSLHEDDIAAISDLYPDSTLSTVYGTLTGNFTNGVTPVPGANIWAQDTTGKVYSNVSGYLADGSGAFRLQLPAGTYTLRAEAIASGFTGGSSVGPYSDTFPTDPSFQPPLYSGSTPMTPRTLGNGTPITFPIVAGCAATAVFRMDGTGSIGGNCGLGPPVTLTVSKTGAGTVTSAPAGINCGATCSASFGTGAVVALTASPAVGSTFVGWSGACTGAGACNVTISAAQGVTANFAVAVQPSITIAKAGTGVGVVTSSPGGFNCGAACALNLAAGTVVTLIPTPNAGSSFMGWSGACTGTGGCTLTVNSALNVTATFNLGGPPPPTLFALTVTKSGSGTGTVTSSPAAITCGATCTASFTSGTVVTLTPAPAGGSSFIGWSGACTGAGACTVTMNAAASVEAVFNVPPPPPPPPGPPSISVTKLGSGTGTITSSPWGFNCGIPCTINLAGGTVITLIPAATAGSTFAGWAGACSGTGNCTVTVNSPLTATATFNSGTPPPPPPPRQTLTASVGGTGTGTLTSSPIGINCSPTCSASFASGTVVTLTPNVGVGSVFAGWGGDCAGSGATCVLTMSAARTASVTFNIAPPPPPQFLLSMSLNGTGTGTVTSSPAGINCGATCSVNFTQSTVVTLTPTPAVGSTFAAWGGDCAGSGPTCTLTMSAARNASATFNTVPPPPPPPQFLLSMSLNGTGTGTVTSSPAGINCGATCSANFVQSTVVTLTPTPAGGSAFASWSGACSGSGACNVTMNAAASVTATFNVIPPPPPPPTGTPSITVVKTGTGTVTSSPWGFNCGIPCFLNLPAGLVITLIPTPSAGSTFTGWSGACLGTGNCTLTVNSALTATATFSGSGPPPPPPTMHTLSVALAGTGTGSVASAPAGISCGATCSASFVQGTMVSLTPTPTGGSSFTGWSGACSGAGACSVTMSAAASVTATFTAAPPPPPATGTPSVRILKAGAGVGLVTSSPWGYYCGGGCFLNLQPGTVITLIPTPNAGSTFGGWSGACTGTGNCTLTVNSGLTATATFN